VDTFIVKSYLTTAVTRSLHAILSTLGLSNRTRTYNQSW